MIQASVIICTYNRREKLYRALLAYQNQTSRDFEVIVTSDGSSDGTTEMLEAFRAKAKFPLHYLWQEDRGFRKSFAVNHAISAAKGKVLIFADDDMIPPPGYVAAYLRKFQKEEGKNLLIYAKYLPVAAEDPYFQPDQIVAGKYWKRFTLAKRIHLLCWALKYRIYFWKKNPRRPKLNGGNFAVSATVMKGINGMDQDFIGWGYEDDDLRRRILAFGALQREAVYQAFCFNLGYEKKEKTTANNPEMLLNAERNCQMARDSSRPTFCQNGLDHPAPFETEF